MNVSESISSAYRYAAGGETERAREIALHILIDAPKHARALHLLGRLADHEGDRQRALDYFRRAAEAADVPAFVYDDLADICQRAGRLAEAEAAGRQAVQRDAMSPTAWHRLGLILIAGDELDESRRCLEQAVALEPTSVDARNNLGIVLQRLGAAELACTQYRQALMLAPGNAATHANLASALNELGDYEEALTFARKAIELVPSLVGPYVFAAISESNLGRHGASLHWLDRAAALAPENVAVLIARADALRLVERAEEGLCCCERATELAPANGEAHNAHGLLLDWLGREPEALAAFDKAISLMPKLAVAWANKGAVLLECGEPDLAMAALDRGLSLDRTLSIAWYTRADAKTFHAGDPDITEMENLLRGGSKARQRQRSAHHAKNDTLLLRYALGKAYLDIGDGVRAFMHLNEGSRIKRAMIAYDAAAMSQWMASIARSYSAARLASLDEPGNKSELPIYIVGMPRSGTTLIEQILASHPQVHALGELTHIETLAREFDECGSCSTSQGSVVRDDLASVGARYLSMIGAPEPGISRVIDKMPTNFLRAGFIHLMLPRARIIHCRREPADTCLSCYSKLFTNGQEFSYDMRELGTYYCDYARLMSHWRAVLPPERFFEVDYEAVVIDFEQQIRRLIAFCGLPWDDACVRFHETKRTIRTASKNQVRRPLYGSSIGRWKHFEAQLGPLIEALSER